ESVPISQVVAAISNTPPAGGKILGGFRYSAVGDRLTEAPDVSFPIRVQDLGLPAGVTPEQATFALTIPRTVHGSIAYEVVDKMEYENGRLVTKSPPFL